MKAKIRFSDGAKTFNAGDIVPESVATKYPRLVEKSTEKEKKEFEQEQEKKEVPGLMLSTEKVKKKK